MAKSTFSPTQKKGLLWLVGILLAVRFGVVPLMDYQNQLREQIALESRQLERAIVLLNQQSHAVSSDQVQRDLRQLQDRVPKHESVNAFRLAMQQELEQAASQQQANIQVFDWLTNTSRHNGFITTHKGQIEIEGAVTDIAQFQLTSVTQIYGLNWLEFTVRPMRGNSQRGELKVPNVRVTLLFEVSGIAASESNNSGEDNG